MPTPSARFAAEGVNVQTPPLQSRAENEKDTQMGVFFILVAGVGFEGPARKYSRLGRVRGSARPILLIFSLVALAVSPFRRARAPSPRPPPSVVEDKAYHSQKRKTHHKGVFSFLARCTDLDISVETIRHIGI